MADAVNPQNLPPGMDLERFLIKTIRTASGCLEWTAGLNTSGYGQFYGTYKGVRRSGLAHHWAWSRAHGDLPEGWVVHHACENHLCVEETHLKGMTRAEHDAIHAPNLRGITAVMKAKEGCAQGHPFDGHDGRQRTCSTCKRRFWRDAARKQRARARAS